MIVKAALLPALKRADCATLMRLRVAIFILGRQGVHSMAQEVYRFSSAR